eukprot:Nk52_evm16s225 gene=Nk52_evmTU16s225
MLVTFALLQVTEVNGNVIGDIVDIEDTTETPAETTNIDILKGGRGECEDMCVNKFKGNFKEFRLDPVKKLEAVICYQVDDNEFPEWVNSDYAEKWCRKCSKNPVAFKVEGCLNCVHD